MKRNQAVDKNAAGTYLDIIDIIYYQTSALKDHEKSDLDPDQDHIPKSDLRSRSDPDLTWKYDLQIVI